MGQIAPVIVLSCPGITWGKVPEYGPMCLRHFLETPVIRPQQHLNGMNYRWYLLLLPGQPTQQPNDPPQ